MRHYILYYHGGSANHGCEALIRTTAELLDYKNNKISLASFRPEDDKKYGIDQFCDIHRMYETKNVNRWNPKWIKAYLQLKLQHKPYSMDDLVMLNAIGAKKGDIALSIGGDNYCYNDTQGLIRANDMLRCNGIKTVLWGCSIEPELLNDPKIAEDISSFDLITARESISYEVLKRINPNTILVSDSAFHLKSVQKPFQRFASPYNMVGLNLSPLAEESEKKPGIARDNYEKLIDYLIGYTDYYILLIPHVIWKDNDDRTINRYFMEKYKETKRVFAVEDANCEEIKGYISRCKFFIGARTHATIAAYSSYVPTLVLGYSVKSKGIAKDLFGSYDDYVLPVQELSTSYDLVNRFKWLVSNEMEIKNQLKLVLPDYKDLIHNAVEAVNKL